MDLKGGVCGSAPSFPPVKIHKPPPLFGSSTCRMLAQLFCLFVALPTNDPLPTHTYRRLKLSRITACSHLFFQTQSLTWAFDFCFREIWLVSLVLCPVSDLPHVQNFEDNTLCYDKLEIWSLPSQIPLTSWKVLIFFKYTHIFIIFNFNR